MSWSSMTLKQRLLLFRALVLWMTGSLLLVAFLAMMAWKWDYYGTPRLERPFHPAHSILRSSGRVGLPAGIGAAALFLLNLGYLVRKRLLNIKFLGPLRMWMDAHVLTGLIGGALVIIHSTLAPSSALGMLALLAMLITLLTGVVGRNIYTRVPRSIEGYELNLTQVQTELNSCRQLLEMAGVEAEWMNRTTPKARLHRTGLLGCFLALIIGDIQRRKEYRNLKQQILSSPKLKGARRKVLPMAKDYCAHWQWLIRYHELRNLLSSWRFFHRWLAILMLCVVVGHIVVALCFADLSSCWGNQ